MRTSHARRLRFYHESVRLVAKGIAARCEPRRRGFLVVGFDDPAGNFVELFPNIETVESAFEAFTAQDLERVMANVPNGREPGPDRRTWRALVFRRFRGVKAQSAAPFNLVPR